MYSSERLRIQNIRLYFAVFWDVFYYILWVRANTCEIHREYIRNTLGPAVLHTIQSEYTLTTLTIHEVPSSTTWCRSASSRSVCQCSLALTCCSPSSPFRGCPSSGSTKCSRPSRPKPYWNVCALMVNERYHLALVRMYWSKVKHVSRCRQRNTCLTLLEYTHEYSKGRYILTNTTWIHLRIYQEYTACARNTCISAKFHVYSTCIPEGVFWSPCIPLCIRVCILVSFSPRQNTIRI